MPCTIPGRFVRAARPAICGESVRKSSSTASAARNCPKDLKPSPDLLLLDGEVSKKETAVKVVEAALEYFGRIDLLVNNAGIFIPKAFTDYTEEDYNLVMNTNVAIW
jgi:NAD(P)-dependent dehydrogenase (short-subunit alcohol dehydrogenase family)